MGECQERKGFRLMGSGLARGAYRPLIAFESSTHQLGVRSEELGVLVRRIKIRSAAEF